jgi:hypothetical protein
MVDALGQDMSPTRTVYHVVPDAAAEMWVIRQENNDSFREAYGTKDEAVRAAKERAHDQEPSQVKVHRHDGHMEYESTYGEDSTQSLE